MSQVPKRNDLHTSAKNPIETSSLNHVIEIPAWNQLFSKKKTPNTPHLSLTTETRVFFLPLCKTKQMIFQTQTHRMNNDDFTEEYNFSRWSPNIPFDLSEEISLFFQATSFKDSITFCVAERDPVGAQNPGRWTPWEMTTGRSKLT